MDNVIILRYSEIHLKGKNRAFFEGILKNNIVKKLKKYNCKTEFFYSRYVVSEYSKSNEEEIVSSLQEVFGLFSLSKALRVKGEVEAISQVAVLLAPSSGSFRVTANRADKTLPYTSVELASKVGERVLANNEKLEVDLHNPQSIIYIDVRDKDNAYVYSDSILCAGGMPVGSSGRGLSLLSGGIDSPVSTYMMAKRGLSITALHFWSYPYTSYEARDKVIELAKILSKYAGSIKVLVVPFTKVQEAIHNNAESKYMITLVRRAMMRIAERVAKKCGAQCIINGENLGQVASQTMESITVINSVIDKMPVFRPLIGFDKIDIISVAQKIGTFDTSIKPYEDCCTVFLPDSPVTKPTIERARLNEEKIIDYDKLLDEAIENIEIFSIDG